MNRASYLLLLIVAIGLSGCTRQLQPAPTGQIEEGLSRIVLEREIGWVGGARSPTISDNGVEIGDIGNGGTLIWDRPAGTSCVTAYNRKFKICFEAKSGREIRLNFSREGFTLQSFDGMQEFDVIEVQ